MIDSKTNLFGVGRALDSFQDWGGQKFRRQSDADCLADNSKKKTVC